MPGRDGSGPAVSESRSGRGWGLCSGADAVKVGNGSGQGLGPGLFCRRGKGRTFNPQRISALQRKKLLQARREILQERLVMLDQQLESL